MTWPYAAKTGLGGGWIGVCQANCTLVTRRATRLHFALYSEANPRHPLQEGNETAVYMVPEPSGALHPDPCPAGFGAFAGNKWAPAAKMAV